MKTSRWNGWRAAGVVAIAAIALVGAACGSSTSSADKTATKAAGAAPTTAATKAASTPATTGTSAATAAATKAATTPTAGAGTTPAAGATTGAGGGIKTGTTSLGTVLTDAAGLTLYTFNNDTTAGKSSCNGTCAATWPPETTTAATAPTVAGATGTFSIITRDDGSKQIAYNGKPLYRYTPDTAPGDTKGDGVGNIWHVAKP